MPDRRPGNEKTPMDDADSFFHESGGVKKAKEMIRKIENLAKILCDKGNPDVLRKTQRESIDALWEKDGVLEPEFFDLLGKIRIEGLKYMPEHERLSHGIEIREIDEGIERLRQTWRETWKAFEDIYDREIEPNKTKILRDLKKHLEEADGQIE